MLYIRPPTPYTRRGVISFRWDIPLRWAVRTVAVLEPDIGYDRAMTNSFKNRIVGIGAEDPEQLLANPGNFRAHPGRQREALIALLDEVGFVAPVIVNRTTGHLVDGHLRVELALSRDEKAIPVSYVELTEDEERLVLATYDSVGDLAFSDKDRLRDLLDSVTSSEAAVQTLLSSVATEAGLLAAVGTPDAKPDHSVTCPACGEVFSPKR
jgi:hypothetical protein